MPETNPQVGKKPNGPEYHGRDRRLPENADLRRAVEARLIACRRLKEIEAAEAGGEKKKRSLLDWD